MSGEEDVPVFFERSCVVNDAAPILILAWLMSFCVLTFKAKDAPAPIDGTRRRGMVETASQSASRIVTNTAI